MSFLVRWSAESAHEAGGDDEVGVGTGCVDEGGVGLVDVGGPCSGCRGVLSESDVAGDESANPLGRVEVDVPDFVELRVDPVPAVVLAE